MVGADLEKKYRMARLGMKMYPLYSFVLAVSTGVLLTMGGGYVLAGIVTAGIAIIALAGTIVCAQLVARQEAFAQMQRVVAKYGVRDERTQRFITDVQELK